MVSYLISVENDSFFFFLVEEYFDALREVYSEIVDSEKDNNMFLYYRNDFDEL